MPEQPRFVSKCPGCEGALCVTRLSCGRCALQLEGQFPIPPLLRLGSDELAFVVAFVRASGSLKAMAQERKQSYPTIRNRLDEIIRKLDDSVAKEQVVRDEARHAILDALDKGELTTAEAALRLQELLT